VGDPFRRKASTADYGLLAALSTVASMLWPRLAVACPACVGTSERNAGFLKIGSLFVLVPFLVVGLVLYVLRQAPERDRTAVAPRRPAPRSIV
jgi:hypothetical protein